jgi:hypothetical protein
MTQTSTTCTPQGPCMHTLLTGSLCSSPFEPKRLLLFPAGIAAVKIPVHRSFSFTRTASATNRGYPRVTIGVRGFSLPVVESHCTLQLSISDELFCWPLPVTMFKPPVGVSGFADSKCSVPRLRISRYADPRYASRSLTAGLH